MFLPGVHHPYRCPPPLPVSAALPGVRHPCRCPPPLPVSATLPGVHHPSRCPPPFPVSTAVPVCEARPSTDAYACFTALTPLFARAGITDMRRARVGGGH